MPIDKIEVLGLNAFRRELKKAEDQFPKAINNINNEVAEIVADAARNRALSQGSTLAKAAPSIRALKGAAKAQVRMGGASYPYAMGAEWGSIRYKQFPLPVPGGRSVYPTIKEKRAEVMNRYGDLIDEVSKEAFPH